MKSIREITFFSDSPVCVSVSSFSPALQTAVRLQGECKSSLHQELKLKRRVQRKHSQQERSLSASSSRGSQSEELTIQDLEREKERQGQEIESIIQVSRRERE